MKFLKYLFLFIGLLALVFVLLGVLKPKLDYDCEIIVDKPLVESWAVTQDESKMADWLAGYQKMEKVSGNPGTVGAVTNVHFINEGQEMVIKETITDIVPNESISMTFESDFMDMDYKMSMEPVGEKTKISSSTTAKGNGLISKSMMALVSSSFISQEETNFSNLKAVIENNTKKYFPSDEIIESLSTQ